MDDLISRQAAIDAVHKTVGKFIPILMVSEENALLDCVREINQLPSAQQWIPCAERLPEDGTYLCWEWQGFCYVDSFKDGNWETAEKCYTKCIAWMPLPEPYKGETDELDTM